MGRFVEGEGRRQQALLPSCLEDYVSEDNPAHVIDVFVDELELGLLGSVLNKVWRRRGSLIQGFWKGALRW